MAETSTDSISLLEEFRRGTVFEAALVSTFNLYFPFLEELVLRRLKSLGCSYIVTLADAGQVTAEISEPSRQPKMAGKRYALLPIPAAGVFHPKIGLFVGPKSARVIVGSHNLTMSGFGLNREVTNVIEVRDKKDREGAAAVQEVVEFSKAWAARSFPSLQKSLDDFSEFARPFQGPVPTESAATVVGSRPDGISLLDRVLPHLPETADRITVVGPFFDQKLEFLRQLHDRLEPTELFVAVEPDTVSFPTEAALPTGTQLVDAAVLETGANASGYLHAKAILVESGDQRYFISGSANPTAAAWLAGPNARNAEMVVVRKLEDEDPLGLSQVSCGARMPTTRIEVSNRRLEPSSSGDSHQKLLVGVATAGGGEILVDAAPPDFERIAVFSSEGEELAVDFDWHGDQLRIRGAALDSASRFEVTATDAVYRGWIHHVDSLRKLALSSSQRRIGDALAGALSGDPTNLEQLLKLVEKVVFQESPTANELRGGGKRDKKSSENQSEQGVVVVPTLKDAEGAGSNRLSSGDLGLLLDMLMRQLWRGLAHEESTPRQNEGELVGSDDEDLLEKLPNDSRVAGLWRKKTATLFRRLIRRVREGEDKSMIVIQCAAVLGILEAVRRVEDHDGWRSLNEDFLDRDLAKKFLIEAAPRLLAPENGVIDAAIEEVGEDFDETAAVVRWMTWLMWTVGFGPSELLSKREKSGLPPDAINGLATVALLAARLSDAAADVGRTRELLDATPRAGMWPEAWLEEFRQLGNAVSNPEGTPKKAGPPEVGDLVSHQGKRPLFVLEVRGGGKKVELVDLSKEKNPVILADRVDVLSPFADLAEKKRA